MKNIQKQNQKQLFPSMIRKESRSSHYSVSEVADDTQLFNVVVYTCKLILQHRSPYIREMNKYPTFIYRMHACL